MAGKIVEAIVLTLCLPIYIALWPIDAISVARKIRTLSKRECPLCGAQMEGLKRTDCRFVASRFVLAAGTKGAIVRTCVLEVLKKSGVSC